jgi:hypothetical protein
MIPLLLAAALAVPPVQKDGVALRFVEAGVFRFSEGQGAEVDLVNDGDQPAACSVKLRLLSENPATGEWKEVRKTEAPSVLLPPRSRAGFRVFEPPAAGRFRVEYEAHARGRPLARDRLEFESPGPWEVSLRPFFLSREGVVVRVARTTPPDGAGPHGFRFTLADPRSGKPLASSDESRPCADAEAVAGIPPREIVEGFLSFKGRPPGTYRIVVEVLSPRAPPLAVAVLALRAPPPRAPVLD